MKLKTHTGSRLADGNNKPQCDVVTCSFLSIARPGNAVCDY